MAAALISGIGAAPAVAAGPSSTLPSLFPEQDEWAAPGSVVADAAVTERLGGVAEELDVAVARGEVTLEQALTFFAQIQARVLGT